MKYLALLILTCGLLILSWIDTKHLVLPDCITLPLLWLGLLLSLFGLFTNPHDAIIGASMGYLSLWITAWVFKQLRGKDGIGHGDFKLTAMFGAWFGWQALPFIIGLAALLGIGLAGILSITGKYPKSQMLPFGPCIAAAGWSTIFWSHNASSWVSFFFGNNIC